MRRQRISVKAVLFRKTSRLRISAACEVTHDRDGRDHNPYGFTMWMAGGGVKRGFSYGKTDELGYKPVENPVSMHDLHATILHLLGLDDRLLTYHFNGRDQSLVNALGSVVHEIVA